MTAGAAYDVCQSTGWRNGLNRKFREAKRFYALIALFTTAAAGLNFIGINPMKALVLAGIVQGFSTPPLMLLIMQISGRASIMGDKTNGKLARAVGWATTVLLFAASVSLVASWMMH
jgi:Mn2+/Fe2+ NRAMP family transporter